MSPVCRLALQKKVVSVGRTLKGCIGPVASLPVYAREVQEGWSVRSGGAPVKRVVLFCPILIPINFEFAPVGRIGNAPDNKLKWILSEVRFVRAERFKLLPVSEELFMLTVTRFVFTDRSGNAPVQFMYWLFTVAAKFSVRRFGLLVRVSNPTWLNSLLLRFISTRLVRDP